MSGKRLTQSQLQLLELLSAFDYLTTRQAWAYLAPEATKRSVEQRLQLLQQHGYIRAALLNPDRGRASERRWSLLKKGSDTLGLPHRPPSDREVRKATQREARVLSLLSEMKQLTTGQIREHVHAEKPGSYTWQLLNLLQRRGYIEGTRLYPERGAASECYWTLRRRGADAIGATYHRGYLRRPSRGTIEHRGLLLQMSRQVEAAGWSLLKPVPQGKRPPGGDEADGQRRLVEAVLHQEESAIRSLIDRGYSAGKVLDRMERVKAGQVGAVVPRTVSDYVAYLPHDIERTVLLIPHPPWAGRTFWTRRTGRRDDRGRAGRVDSPQARIELYSRLARVIPVVAVFGRREAASRFCGPLEAAGLRWFLVDEVRDRLAELAGSCEMG
jgi:hypothetical protein